MKLIESDDYASITWESLGVRRRNKIAVLNAVGAITSGRSGYDPVNGAVMGSDSFVEYIRRIRGDSSIRAIILRVDSHGGSSTASDVCGLASVTGEHYEGGHWLGSFAVYLTTKRGL